MNAGIGKENFPRYTPMVQPINPALRYSMDLHAPTLPLVLSQPSKPARSIFLLFLSAVEMANFPLFVTLSAYARKIAWSSPWRYTRRIPILGDFLKFHLTIAYIICRLFVDFRALPGKIGLILGWLAAWLWKLIKAVWCGFLYLLKQTWISLKTYQYGRLHHDMLSIVKSALVGVFFNYPVWVWRKNWLREDFARKSDKQWLSISRKTYTPQEIHTVFTEAYPAHEGYPSDIQEIERFLRRRHPETKEHASKRLEHESKTGQPENALCWLMSLKNDKGEFVLSQQVRDVVFVLNNERMSGLCGRSLELCTSKEPDADHYPEAAKELLEFEVTEIKQQLKAWKCGRSSFWCYFWLTVLCLISFALIGSNLYAAVRKRNWLTILRAAWALWRTALGVIDLSARPFANPRTSVEYLSIRLIGAAVTIILANVAFLPSIAAVELKVWYRIAYFFAGLDWQVFVQLGKRFIVDHYYLPEIALNGVGSPEQQQRVQRFQGEWDQRVIIFLAYTDPRELSRPLDWQIAVLKRRFTRLKKVSSALLPLDHVVEHPNTDIEIKIYFTQATAATGAITCAALVKETLGFNLGLIYFTVATFRALEDSFEPLQSAKTATTNFSLIAASQLPPTVFGVLPQLVYPTVFQIRPLFWTSFAVIGVTSLSTDEIGKKLKDWRQVSGNSNALELPALRQDTEGGGGEMGGQAR